MPRNIKLYSKTATIILFKTNKSNGEKLQLTLKYYEKVKSLKVQRFKIYHLGYALQCVARFKHRYLKFAMSIFVA